MEEQQNQNQNQQFDFEDEQIAIKNSLSHTDHGWQKVVYPKRQRKSKSDSGSNQINNNGGNQKSNVFSSVEEHAEERRKKDAQRKAAIADAEFEDRLVTRIKHHDEYDEDNDEYDSENGGGKIEEVKKVKEKKKVKKMKVTVAEAANKIDAADLAAFLIDATASYEAQENIQLMRFADYFARAFSAVKNAEFPWTKMFKESTVGKMADVPLNDVPEEVYKTSTDWINKRSSEAVGTFILWSLDTIFADLASHQVPTKGSKKVVHHGTSKAQVALFVALAMVLRKKPDVLISLLPKLREEAKYQGQDKLPVMLWVAAQASQGDLVVGMYAWVQNLFPVVSGKSCNTQSRDLVLQLLERLLAAPKARSILLNGAVRKGERLVPPSAFDLLMRATFPPTSSRIKATERFEAAYPTLKELALAGTPGSKAMKQVTQQIFTSALKAAGDGIPDLTSESASVAIWCLTQNPDCYKLWDTLYLDNVEASATILKKLSDEWKVHSAKHATLDPVRVAIQSFRQKNESAIAKGGDTGSFRTADKYAKNLLGRVSRGNGCVKSLLVVGVAISAAYIYMSPDLQGQLDWNKLSAMFAPTGSS